MTTPQDILDFWFPCRMDSPEGLLRLLGIWNGGPEVDAAIRARFGETLDEALAGGHEDWAETPEGELALITLLDQAPRSVYRGTPKQWSGDARALTWATRWFESDAAWRFPAEQRQVALFPFVHAEDLAAQTRSVELARRNVPELPEIADPLKPGLLKRGEDYRDMIARFGRFPFRNEVAGRASTPEEVAFLETWQMGPPDGMIEYIGQLHRSLAARDG